MASTLPLAKSSGERADAALDPRDGPWHDEEPRLAGALPVGGIGVMSLLPLLTR
jgi:hypothetical protein